jgi:hypothetical protein
VRQLAAATGDGSLGFAGSPGQLETSLNSGYTVGPCNSYLEGPTLISEPAARALRIRRRRRRSQRRERLCSLLRAAARDLPTLAAHATTLDLRPAPRDRGLLGHSLLACHTRRTFVHPRRQAWLVSALHAPVSNPETANADRQHDADRAESPPRSAHYARTPKTANAERFSTLAAHVTAPPPIGAARSAGVRNHGPFLAAMPCDLDLLKLRCNHGH